MKNYRGFKTRFDCTVIERMWIFDLYFMSVSNVSHGALMLETFKILHAIIFEHLGKDLYL